MPFGRHDSVVCSSSINIRPVAHITLFHHPPFLLLKINFLCSDCHELYAAPHDPLTDCPSEDPPARVEGWPSVEFISRRIADTGQLQRCPSGVSVEAQPAAQLESN